MLEQTRAQIKFLGQMGFERLGPIEMEDRLKAIGYEIDLTKTWANELRHPASGNLVDYRMIYPKNPDNVNRAALTELRKTYFVFSNGFIWDIGG